MSNDFARLFPPKLYDAIRTSSFASLYKAGKGDPRLYENINPVIQQFKINDKVVEYIYYSADLLRYWLLDLCLEHNMGKKMMVYLSKSGKTKDVWCYNGISTSTEVTASPKVTSVSRLNAVAELINILLVNKGTKLMTPAYLGTDVIPIEQTTAIDTVVKGSRLDDLKYKKAAMYTDNQGKWKAFHDSELFRFTYILLASGKWKSIPSKNLLGLSKDAAMSFNTDILKDLYNDGINDLIAQITIVSMDAIVADNTVKPLAINTGIISYQQSQAEKKVLDSVERAEAKKALEKSGKTMTYKEMIEIYYAMTNYMLDISKEKKIKTMPFRLKQIAYMNNVIAKNPESMFIHNIKLDRIMPLS
jgi:hypothetical protein